MRYEGNKVVISESEIRYLVNESVKNYLRENGENELFNGIKGLFSGAADDVRGWYQTQKQRYATSEIQGRLTQLYKYREYYNNQLEALEQQKETEIQNMIEKEKEINRQIEELEAMLSRSKEQSNNIRTRQQDRVNGRAGAENLMNGY